MKGIDREDRNSERIRRDREQNERKRETVRRE